MQDAIRRDVITGRLTPGDRVTEASLAARYRVSRVPVREALRGLESEGFIVPRPHVGSRVAAVPVADADDLFAIRETIEVSTARRAALRASTIWSGDDTPDEWFVQRREIASLLDEGDACLVRGDLDTLVDVHDRFHLAVASLAASDVLQRLLRHVTWNIEWLYSTDPHARGSRLWPEHRVIVAAIDAGDTARAASLMGAHVRESRLTYLARYEGRGTSADPAVAAAVDERRRTP
ncbi:GntR family transcriptional regulator [Xylanimonas allomyrinae]|uniref:GntR family transcriptional regulator n=1 Tax=Xylanimonas allomyrinae TaxID=2509459 RepID=A0A4P6EYB8_9MICO|nr:GntR family transcriptional regulator [Xylanimonas allomyrinae]QAY63058.1 GntR family transcriptional regulator [Xylanimonas allomyrinae]